MWPRITKACPADSESRLEPVQTDFTMPPNLKTRNASPHMTEGYVSNYTLSTSLCHQPDLQGLHGFLVEPISIATGDKLFPMFGSSKLTVNSEILIPAAMYIKGDARFNPGNYVPWEEKNSSMVWRGIASGGRNKESNWKAFHRHRLVSMLNGTQAIATQIIRGSSTLKASLLTNITCRYGIMPQNHGLKLSATGFSPGQMLASTT